MTSQFARAAHMISRAPRLLSKVQLHLHLGKYVCVFVCVCVCVCVCV
jgi:hypothetical protein